MAVRIGVIFGICALIVLVTLNDRACGVFLREHGVAMIRGVAAIFVGATIAYLSYCAARCRFGDAGSRRQSWNRLRTQIGRRGSVLLAGNIKMIAILVGRPGHHAAWLTCLPLAIVILGLGLRRFRLEFTVRRERAAIVGGT
jgi:hypothetical protein